MRPRLLVVCAVLPLCSPFQVRAQPATSPSDHAFACLTDGLTRNKAFGCQLLARPTLTLSGDGPFYWHLRTYATRRTANAAKRDGDAVVSADGRIWLSSIGPRTDAHRRGTHVASIGPLDIPKAAAHHVELYYVIMPAHEHTRVHTHSGPEAWYVLEGEQCLDTPDGPQRVHRGDTALAAVRSGVPMQLTNTGSRPRRALFIVVHDTAQQWMTISDWKPTGACAPKP
jgi:quercetin dioxygenase-like cupin family protein